MKAALPNSIEPTEFFRQWVINAFDQIANYLSDELYVRGQKINDHEVLIITHYNIISMLQEASDWDDELMGFFDPTDITEMEITI